MADPAIELNGLIDRLCSCRLRAQQELQMAEQECVAHPESSVWPRRVKAARNLVRHCTDEIQHVRDDLAEIVPRQRKPPLR